MKLFVFLTAVVCLSIAFVLSYQKCSDVDVATLSDHSRKSDLSWILLSGCLFISTFWMFRFCPSSWAIIVGFSALTALITIKLQNERMSYLHVSFVALSFLITACFLVNGKHYSILAVYCILFFLFLDAIYRKNNKATMTIEYLSFILNLCVVFFAMPDGQCGLPFLKSKVVGK